MNIRTYRAGTMKEALDLVRRELGGEAIILSTRQVLKKRRFPWQKAQNEAEVVAGIAEQTDALRQSAGKDADRPGSNAAPSFSSTATAAAQITTAVDELAERIARRRQESLDDNAAHHQRHSDDRSESTLLPEIKSHTARPAHPPAASDARHETVESLMAQLNAASSRLGRTEMPDDLFHLYTQLIDADVSDDDARELVLQLKANLDLAGTTDISRAAAELSRLVEQSLTCCGPIQTGSSRPTVAALVGPTGVGKTTTIAKLAANFKLRDRLDVGLVTVDTYRVAAVEQLRTYAEIIDLPMHVVTSPAEMRRSIDELADMDLVLIDTAGRSPRDELRIQELRTLLAEANVDQVHLVMSLNSSLRSLEATAARFRTVGASSMLLTKLDEAPAPGVILSAARRIDLPISYLTTGQDVPDDIEAAAPARLARLIVGRDDLTQHASFP
ncbi:MAG: flagellar biosynthesis protein FlhF [Planctomycetota bacterium]|nr:MAG: flagellar biosynthesis protein FlhF [Planctomycetota bacterium]REK24243.1 MAG: flagellar biosynthesis protein FlhF [Planctomycetota bacterium]REK28772.1 MAG: flagellar biosynthesis protein FlhF [Planctomycetota bacterium]